MKVGIFFGGKSREREVSFAGGRTVFDILDKTLFQPVLIFIDSTGNLIHLDWQYLYKGSIRDFYPPIEDLPESPNNFQIYIESLGKISAEKQNAIISKVGQKIEVIDLPDMIDFAFLALHGPYGEDGTIQGLLDYYDIPYSGSGIFPSSFGIDKALQKKLFHQLGLVSLSYKKIARTNWTGKKSKEALYKEVCKDIGDSIVVKSSTQGSSIGVFILQNHSIEDFTWAVNRSFFITEVKIKEWTQKNNDEKAAYVRRLTDLQEGLGLPLKSNGKILYHPGEVLNHFDHLSKKQDTGSVTLEALQAEPAVIIEPFIHGKEFSCIVIQKEDGSPLALPPTEIRKSGDVFDYRAKYLPGISNKVTPIDLPENQIEAIRNQCEDLFYRLDFNVYARIDGFITHEGKIYLNDPNTTSGMLPSSFFFHQAAEIGLSPSQFITYIIRTSLFERSKNACAASHYTGLLNKLDQQIENLKKEKSEKLKVGVILGGFSSERHISVESGRNVFEKLSSSEKYKPIPIFLSGGPGNLEFYRIPVNILLKDNADDIRNKIENFKISGVTHRIIEQAGELTQKYASPGYEFHPRPLRIEDFNQLFDFVFLALHGRPGEDGTLQEKLISYGIPYNGSGPEAASMTIDKYRTNQFLSAKGFSVPKSLLIKKEDWDKSPEEYLQNIEKQTAYPLVAKPTDDGCSSAVKKISDPQQLKNYISLIFRKNPRLPAKGQGSIKIKPNEEFPRKSYFMAEELVSGKQSKRFLEITGGMISHYNRQGQIQWEIFEPSEAFAEAGILSLEEKFLAGEGQNITPARFSADPEINHSTSTRVKAELEKVAHTLGIEGYCRIDGFVRINNDQNAELIILEINALPGLTPATAIFHQAALNGYRPVDFLDKIISFGMQKNKKGESVKISI